MFVGAICFTSSGSNGGCWVVLVSPPPPFFPGKKVFFLATCAKKQSLRDLRLTKKVLVEKKTRLAPKKSYVTYGKKTRFMLVSAIELRFPHS